MNNRNKKNRKIKFYDNTDALTPGYMSLQDSAVSLGDLAQHLPVVWKMQDDLITYHMEEPTKGISYCRETVVHYNELYRYNLMGI